MIVDRVDVNSPDELCQFAFWRSDAKGHKLPLPMSAFIDYKTSMITDEDPLRGLLFHLVLGFSHTLHVLEERRRTRSKIRPGADSAGTPGRFSSWVVVKVLAFSVHGLG